MFIHKSLLVFFCCSFVCSKDVPITWLSSPRASLPCVVPDPDRIVIRRPPPPLNSDDLPRPRQPYLWRRGEEELKRVLSNGTLEVSRKKDGSSEGVYQCAVRHSAGLVLGYPLHLKFAYLDKYFSVNPENATVWEGQSHVLTCDISSGPNASVSWQKDGEPLPARDRHHVLKNQLLILDVTKEDGGFYRCKATNSEANRTRVSYGGRLKVESSTSDLSPAFLPIQHKGNITATEGETVTLACPVIGYPKPTLLWEFTAPGERTAELGHVDEVLMVQDFDMTQQGIYTCTIEENKSMFKTFNISLSVPARITLPPISKAALQASTVRFNCTAVGNPTPTITWYKNGQPLKLTGRTMVLPSGLEKRKELLIRSVTTEDAGIYQCFADNGHSMASAWAVFNVTGKTEPAPSGVMCWPTDAEHVLVRWPTVTNSMAYTVMTSNPDGSLFPSQPLKITEHRTSTLDTLTPYKFQIRAYIQQSKLTKNVKPTDMSESVTCHGQGVPIRLSRLVDGVYVSWRHFPSRKLDVKQWILQYRTMDETEEHNITLGPEISNYTIPTLSSEDLQVRLLGTRQLPWLHQNLTLVPWRSTANDEPGGVIGKIDNVEVSDVEPTKFTVHWRCEDADTSEAHYVYNVCTKIPDDVKEQCIESHDKWVTVEDLTPSTEYIIKVRALVPLQPDFVTEFTQPIYVSTPSLGQEPIKDLSYKVVNGSTLRVSWNSGVDKYRVYYNDKLVLPIHTWSSVDTVGNTVLINNVDTSKELYVIVSGYDPVGYSPVLRIPTHEPGAKELDYTFNSKGLTVTWDNREPRVVRFSQNLTQPLEQWTTIYVTGDIVHINSLDPSLITYLEVVAPDQSSSQMFTLPPRQRANTSLQPSSEPISDLTYRVMNATALQVIWTGMMDKYTVYYNTEMKLPIDQWHSIDTTDNTALITNVNRSKELYVVVLGYNPSGHSPVLHIPVHVPKTQELNYTFTSSGLTVTWQEPKVRVVRYSQNLTLPQDLWTTVNVTDDVMHIFGLNPSKFTYIDVTSPGEEARQVATVPPPQPDNTADQHSSEPIMDLTYKVINGSTLRVSWTSPMDKYTVYYNSALTLPVHHWPSVDTRENTVLLTNVNTSKELYVMVLGYNPVGYSFFLHIPVKKETNESGANMNVKYTFTSTGLEVTWKKQRSLQVWYSQNLTQPPDQWASAKGTGDSITISELSPALPTYVVVTAPRQSARVLTVPPRPADNPLITRTDSIKDLMYKVINGSTVRVSWNSFMEKYTVYYSPEQNLSINQWPSVETIGNTVLITNVNTSKDLYVTVRRHEPDGYSAVLHVPPKGTEDLTYEFTRTGLTVSWKNKEARTVMYSQNLTQPLERWTVINVTDNCVHIAGLDPLLRTFVVAQAPGQAASQVLTVPPRPPDSSSVYFSVGIGCAVLLLCVVVAAVVCIWHRRKRARPAARSRRRSISPSDGNEEEMAEMKNAGRQLANGGPSKDAGEPLLNGHVHITENPIPLKTPNGRMRRGHRYEPTFDMSRYEEPDTTLETTLNSTSSAAFNLLDTSRSPGYDLARSSQNLSANNSFNKLPDDNMNSELTRSTDFQLDNSKILPTLQPNG